MVRFWLVPLSLFAVSYRNDLNYLWRDYQQFMTPPDRPSRTRVLTDTIHSKPRQAKTLTAKPFRRSEWNFRVQYLWNRNRKDIFGLSFEIRTVSSYPTGIFSQTHTLGTMEWPQTYWTLRPCEPCVCLFLWFCSNFICMRRIVQKTKPADTWRRRKTELMLIWFNTSRPFCCAHKKRVTGLEKIPSPQ